MDVTIGGVILLWGYFFWPIVVSASFAMFRRSSQVEFFFVSLFFGSIGFILFNFVQFIDFLNRKSSLVIQLSFYASIIFPIITATLITAYYKKKKSYSK